MTRITKEDYDGRQELCTCDHMLKSHKLTVKWNKKKMKHIARVKCKFCKCNMLVLTEPAMKLPTWGKVVFK